MPSANVESARSFMDAFNRQDVLYMKGLATDDFVLVPLRAALEDLTYTGPEGIEQWMADLRESWSEIRIEIDEYRELAPGTLLTLGRVIARGHGSSAPVEAEAAWVATIRDGRVIRLVTYMDRDAAIRAATAES
jgi:ketosteroid isomerase-like protein